MNLNNKSIEECMALLSETAEYANYGKALQRADNASPYEIPKADGELKFAAKQLRLLMEQSGVTLAHTTQVINAIKVQLYKL